MKTVLLYTFLFLAIFLAGCKDKNPNPLPDIPYVQINRQIDMNLPQYLPLQQPNGFVYLNDEGAKGVIVINNNGTYVALERNCTFQPKDDCARVSVDNSRFFIACGEYDSTSFVKCCNSRFNLDGSILQGPTTYPLFPYVVSRSGSVLIISN